MRLRRFHAPDLPPTGDVWLDGDEGAHLARVLRAKVGTEVILVSGAGRAVRATVVETERRRARLELRADVLSAVPPRVVTLFVAVPRGDRMERLIAQSVEAGVHSVVPMAWRRSERAAAGRGSRRSRWQRAALEAMKQCGRADLPRVGETLDLPAALAASSSALRLVATPGAARRVEEIAVEMPEPPVAIFVGPEGGLDAEETDALAATGAQAFGLGDVILRIETAAVIAVHRAVWARSSARATATGTPAGAPGGGVST